MQTFLPLPEYRETARVLDDEHPGGRLGNQCYCECLILNNGGWSKHPASKMWRGYEHSFCEYAIALAQELIRRGRVEVGKKWLVFWRLRREQYQNTGHPPWLGNEAFHAAHRAALLWKNPTWYGQFGWSEKPDEPENGKHHYVWPVS